MLGLEKSRGDSAGTEEGASEGLFAFGAFWFSKKNGM